MDLDRSLAFWTELVGLDLSTRTGSYAFLDGGGTQLTLNQVNERPDDDSLTEVVFEVEDVEATYADLQERGVPFEVELRPVTSVGARELWAAHFHDPDGHLASVVGWVG